MWLLLLLPSALALTPEWTALSGATHPDCARAAPCRLLEGPDSFEVTFATEIGGESVKILKALRIRDLKTGKVQEFKSLDAINPVDEKKAFELYRVKFRPGGETDIAFHAFDSAREGEVFLYFLYAPERHQFVVTSETLPKLAYRPADKEYRSIEQGTRYALTTDLKFVLKQGQDQ